MDNFQSIAALAIVVITAAVMFYFKIRKKNNGCAEGCGCTKPTAKSLRS